MGSLSEQLLMEGSALTAGGSGAAPAPDSRRWWVLLAFSANCAVNAFMFMDFTTVPTVTKQVCSLSPPVCLSLCL